jgi:BMFP domain-containing protein YqiC
MQTDSKIIDDIVKLATGIFGNANQVRKDMEESFRAKVESIFSGMGIAVNREEFEALRDMVQHLSDKVEKLETEKLEKRL